MTNHRIFGIMLRVDLSITHLVRDRWTTAVAIEHISSPSLPQRIESQSVLRNSLLLLGFHVLTKLLAFVSFILLANYLGTQLFGVYTYAFALGALFIPLCDLGMDIYLMREVPRLSAEQIPKQFGAALAWKGLLTFLVFVALSITAAILDSFASERFSIVVLAGLVTLLRTYWTTFGSLFRALNRVGYETGLLSLARIAEFLVIVLCLRFDTGLMLLLSMLAIVNLASVGSTYVLVRARFTAPVVQQDTAYLLAMVKGSLPFALTAIFISFYFNFDTVLVAKFINSEAAGIYRAAYNLILPLIMIAAAVSGAIFPFASQNYPSHREDVARVIQHGATHLLIIGLPIAVGTTLLSEKIVAWIFEPAYAPSAVCLSILVWFLPIVYITNLLANSLGAMNQQPFVLRVTTVNVIFNVCANLLVIPRYAQIGASVTTVLTELLGLVLLITRMRREIHTIIPFTMLARILFSGAVMCGFLLLGLDLHVFFLFLFSAVIYAATLVAVRVLRRQDLRTLLSVMKSPPSNI